LAASCAALIAFIGVCHEVVGESLFPWAPATFGGPFGWHALGIAAIAGGVLSIAGTLGVLRFPVVACSLLAALAGVAIFIFTAAVHHEFHALALALASAGIATACFHQSAAPRRFPKGHSGVVVTMPVGRRRKAVRPLRASERPEE
jgi:hypothetical protein